MKIKSFGMFMSRDVYLVLLLFLFFFFFFFLFFFFFFFFFFLSFKIWLVGSFPSGIVACHFFQLLYNCQLLCYWLLALNTEDEVFPRPIFPDIAPSRMFTANSLCLIFLLSPFEKLYHSLFYLSILFLTFFSSSMFQTHWQTFLLFFPRVHVSDP